MKLDHSIFECVQCSKYANFCVRNATNSLSIKTVSWKWQNFERHTFIVHYNCDIVTFQDLKFPYRFHCGYEYEYDVEIF